MGKGLKRRNNGRKKKKSMLLKACTTKRLIQLENQIGIRKMDLHSSFSLTKEFLQWTAVTATITKQAGLELATGKVFEHFSFRKTKLMASQMLHWKAIVHFPFSQLTKCFYGHSWKAEKFHCSFLKWNFPPNLCHKNAGGLPSHLDYFLKHFFQGL